MGWLHGGASSGVPLKRTLSRERSRRDDTNAMTSAKEIAKQAVVSFL